GQAAGRSERIVRWDRVLLPRSEGAVHVDPQDLAEQRLQVLSVALRIALAAAVAQADVEKTVGPESELAAIVVVERLVDHQQDAFAESIGLVRIRTGSRVLGEHRLKLQAQTPRGINEEAAIRAEDVVKLEAGQSRSSA